MGPPARILLADDEDTFRTSVAVLLRREGYVCDVAGNAEEVSDLLTKGQYDLLICDLRMPGNTDLELLRGLASGGSSLPIIAVTAYPSVATAVAAMRCAV